MSVNQIAKPHSSVHQSDYIGSKPAIRPEVEGHYETVKPLILVMCLL